MNRGDFPRSVVTVGHSNRDLETFLELLGAHGVRILIDVRSYPNSRRFPHFSEGNLTESLGEVNVEYEHWPRLGGFRGEREGSENTALSSGFQAVADHLNSEEGQAALDDLTGMLQKRGENGVVALMCAEKDPGRCHRRLISDHLVARDRSVTHVIDEGETRNHELHQHAQTRNRKVYYPGLL